MLIKGKLIKFIEIQKRNSFHIPYIKCGLRYLLLLLKNSEEAVVM